MKFRIKGTTEVLVFRITDFGTIVLWPEGNKSHYIDDSFSDYDLREFGETLFDSFAVPELEISADGVLWWQMVDPNKENPSMEIIRPK